MAAFYVWQPRGETETASLRRERRLLGILLAVVLAVSTPLAIWATPDWAGSGERPLVYGDSPLYISEYMSANTRYYDNEGDSADWIEVCNGGTEELNLRGFALVMGDRSFLFPRYLLAAGAHAVVWLDGGGHTAWHAPFKLAAAGGETVHLTNASGEIVDECVTKPTERNTAVIRAVSADGTIAEEVTTLPTPAFPNTEQGAKDYTASLYVDNDTGIRLNEVMAANGSAIADEFGNFVDYIELHNTTNHTVDISGFGLSDKEYNPLKWVFPQGTVIPAKGYVLVYLSKTYELTDADGQTVLMESTTGAFLAPFAINKLGETVFLTNKSGRFIDHVDTGVLSNDQALMRQEDGSWIRSFAASPGYPNTAQGAVQSQEKQQTAAPVSGLHISEASSRNTASAPLDGQYYDWIELYNPTDKPVCLSGYTLTDDLAVKDKYTLPNVTVPAGGYQLVYADTAVLTDALNTGFTLNGVCYVALFSPSGEQVDYIRLSELPLNVSKGRVEGAHLWMYFTTPTPSKANGTGYTHIAPTPAADTPTGVYNDVDAVTVTLSGEGAVYYTTDGSVPTASSTRYVAPLTLTKTTVLRAVCIADNAVSSAVATYSYIINEHHTVDVVSLVSEPDGIFSEETGIYATGSGASSNFPYMGANFWQDWERACTVQLLPVMKEESGFSVECGVSIFGAYSRAYDKKSLKLRFRDIYGAGKLQYPLFETRDFTEFESLVLRAGGQDTYRCMMKDDLTVTLAGDVVDSMATRPIILYINGEYFGVYYIREKISEDFIASHYNVSPESVDLLQANGYTVNAGDNTDWLALMDYVKSHDLTVAKHYNYVAERVDLQNYADYLIAELYCGNTDLGNIRFFRSSEGDGKWRWILYDTDMGFQGGHLNSVWEMLNPAGTGASDAISTTLINKLLKNDTFRALFVERLEYQMDNLWNTERVLAHIDHFENVWKDEAERNSIRWEHSTDWATNVNGLRYFARNRMDALRNEFETSARVRRIISLSKAELDRCFKETAE